MWQMLGLRGAEVPFDCGYRRAQGKLRGGLRPQEMGGDAGRGLASGWRRGVVADARLRGAEVPFDCGYRRAQGRPRLRPQEMGWWHPYKVGG
ncbi:MAG TPA: hypothetical protein VMR52_01275 [Dehalococcoidia bacterium]|nr:hypothetical protein [Dehalococcoidia bacterium]